MCLYLNNDTLHIYFYILPYTLSTTFTYNPQLNIVNIIIIERGDSVKAPLKLGRPLFFESPDELIDLFLDYIDDCITENKLPNMAGFRANKVIPKSTLNKYEHNDAFVDAFTFIRDILQDETLNNKSIDPSTKKLVLQSKYGYTDKQEINQTSLNADLTMDTELIDKLTAKYLKSE